MQPVFTIITVTYNAERWLETTIQSVLSQSYPNIEYIIIDGGSVDKTTDIIEQYKSGIAYSISEPDKGLYDAMNKGLKQANGDYVWFVNAGDSLYSAETVQEIVNCLSGQGTFPDIIYGETEIVDGEGTVLGMRRLKTPEKLTWKSFKMGMLVCHQSFIAKRIIAPEFNLAYRFSSDFDWCIRCLKESTHVYNTKITLSRFLDAGMTTNNRKASLKERYEIMCNYYGKSTTTLLHAWFAVRFYTAKWFKGRV